MIEINFIDPALDGFYAHQEFLQWLVSEQRREAGVADPHEFDFDFLFSDDHLLNGPAFDLLREAAIRPACCVSAPSFEWHEAATPKLTPSEGTAALKLLVEDGTMVAAPHPPAPELGRRLSREEQRKRLCAYCAPLDRQDTQECPVSTHL